MSGTGERFQQWWDRLTMPEQVHTAACAEADQVDASMLAIFARYGPIGVYGVRWAGDQAPVMSGPFLDFVRAMGNESTAHQQPGRTGVAP